MEMLFIILMLVNIYINFIVLASVHNIIKALGVHTEALTSLINC